jgi:hypothetical protein
MIFRSIILVNIILIIIGTSLKYFKLNKRSFAIKFLECFSFVNNNKILFKINPTTNREGQFKYIHGLRVVSIFWVLISHVYLFHPFPEFPEKISPVSRLIDVRTMVQYLSTHLIINAGLAVGTFYIIRLLTDFSKQFFNYYFFLLVVR